MKIQTYKYRKYCGRFRENHPLFVIFKITFSRLDTSHQVKFLQRQNMLPQ